MARGVNKVILIGNLGADPETRYTANGGAITTIRLATSESWTDKAGQKQERTEWHRVKFFGKLAEIAGEYLKKGRQVYVEGAIRSDKFTGQDGQEKYMFEVVANEMQMLGGGERGEGASFGGGGGGSRERAPRGAPAGAGAGAVAERSGALRNAPPADDFQDDDIPF